MPAAGEAEAPPRSLVLTESDRQIVVSRLARAVLRFQDDFLTRDASPAGLLCQVWLPEVTQEDNQIVLKTKGLPFCVAGMGDLLALFRCISCRFAFGTNVHRPNTLGAPGRVFTSSEPEMCCNVQQYAKTAYLRKAEAEQCQVQSTLLLPLFISPRRSGCVGVLEVVQTSEDMAFADVAQLLSTALEKCELFTCSLEAVQRRAPAAATATTLVLPAQTGVLRPPPPGNTSEEESAGPLRDSGGANGDAAMADAPVRGGMAAANGRGAGGGADSGETTGDDDEDGDGEGMSDDDSDGGDRRKGAARDGGAAAEGKSQGRRKGAGNPGKPGVRLTLADLQSQFGVGLKEAAHRLGICPTTLKRACRRHGIQRWPRRQLQKVNKALDELEARQMLQPLQHLAAAPPAGTQYDTALPAADTRWTALAHFIPAYQNSNMLAYGEQQQLLQSSPAVPMAQGMLSWASQQLQQQPQQAAFLGQQHQLLIQQQQHQLSHQHQQQIMAAAAAAAGGGRATPPASRVSLPDGVLPMNGGDLTSAAAVMQEVSTVSGVSTLGQPPPVAQHPAQNMQQQTAQQQQQAAAGRRSFDSVAQQHQHQQRRSMEAVLALQQRGALALQQAAVAGGQPQRQGSGSGAPISADFLQRATAGASYVSPFNLAGAANAPIVRLPEGALAAAGQPSVPSISALSVPSIHVDMMPSLIGGLTGAVNGRATAAGVSSAGGGSGGSQPGQDDDQVGFLDSSVLELLLTEEQRHALTAHNACARAAAQQPAASLVGGDAPGTSSVLLPAVPAASGPGVSAGLSGLSFML